MKFEISKMKQSDAVEISKWHYEGMYSFYDFSQDEEDLRELLDPDNWNSLYYSVHDEFGALVGFFSFYEKGEDIEVGLGLRPDLTGKGYGVTFLESGMAFAISKFKPKSISVSVAKFNERAIKVYKNAGFEVISSFKNFTNGAWYDFLHMRMEV